MNKKTSVDKGITRKADNFRTDFLDEIYFFLHICILLHRIKERKEQFDLSVTPCAVIVITFIHFEGIS